MLWRLSARAYMRLTTQTRKLSRFLIVAAVAAVAVVVAAVAVAVAAVAVVVVVVAALSRLCVELLYLGCFQD